MKHMNSEEVMQLALQGEELLEEERYEKALAIFEQVISLAPLEPMGYMGKAQTLVEMGYEGEGLAVLDAALARQPQEVVYLYTKVELLESLGRYDEAKVAYRQAAELNPRGNVDAEGEGLLEQLQRYGKEREASRGAGEVNPLDPAIWFEQARTLEMLGHYKEALEVCNQVIADAPEWVVPWYKKVELLNRLGRRAEAEQAAQRIRAMVGEREAKAPGDEPDKLG
jgi:tetratricopeptide (TPR) repeat protein